MNRRLLVSLLAMIPLFLFVGYPLSALLWSALSDGTGGVSLAPLSEAVSNPSYLGVLVSTIVLCLLTAAISVAVALPMALFVWSRPPKYQPLGLILLVLPMFMSYIVKVYTMRSLLGLNGFFNQLLLGSGIIEKPTTLLLFNRGSILATFVVLYIPFAALPIFLSLERIPTNFLSASRDLGASYGRSLRDVVIPLAAPGLVAAGLFSFVLALGDFVTPQMVGGPGGMTFGRIVWSQFGLAFNYSMGAALGLVLLIVTLLALGGAAYATRTIVGRSQ